jgi:hypothetical protein
MPRDKPGTSDAAADADINKCEVLLRQSRKIVYIVYVFFFKKLSSDDERAKTVSGRRRN